MKTTPPRLAQRFFCWYCTNDLRDSILGDLEEQFHRNITRYGRTNAKVLYWISVFRFINRFTLKSTKKTRNTYNLLGTMTPNYIRYAWRFFSRNKAFTLINTFGLTLGFSSFLLIFFFIQHEFSFDRFHTNKSQIYRINFAYEDNAGNTTRLVNSPPALAPGVRGNFPEVQKISRLRYAMNCLLVQGDNQFYEDRGYYADSVFLDILKFELSSGDRERALDQPNSIVITEALAMKYFGRTDPLGATIMLNGTTPLQVTGILADIPSNSHLNFNFLISFATYQVPDGYASDLSSWRWLGFLTYMELKPHASAPNFEQKLVRHFESLTPENRNAMVPSIQQLPDIYLRSGDLVDDLASPIRSGNPFNTNALLIVAILILVIAGFNFSNLTMAVSATRSKATGIRKILGSGKGGVMAQFIVESWILAFSCLLLSCTLVVVAFPLIAEFLGWEFTIGWKGLLALSPYLIVLAAFMATASGLYPALTLAHIDLSKSLKGVVTKGNRHPFQTRNLLVTLQFAIAIGLIAATIVMTRQIDHFRGQETGYNAEHVVLIKMLPEDMHRYFDTFKKDLLQQHSVASVSRSERVIGDPWPFSSIQRVGQSPDERKRVFFNLADYDYFETLGIPLHSGRSFSRDFSSDATKSIILNQQAVEHLGLDDPLGEQVHFFELDGPRTVVGVVEDFNYASLHQEIGPAVVILPFIDLEYMYIRFSPGNTQQQIETMERLWQKMATDTPLQWRFLNRDLEQLYHSEEKLSLMIQVFSALAILLACLGLYGIVAFVIYQRIKEVGIRKVLGASVTSLYVLFVQKYLYQAILAVILIVPVTHYCLNAWLDNFAYRIQINWLVYPLATMSLVLMVLITVSHQILKAAILNPTSLLKNE